MTRSDGLPDDRVFCTQCQACDPARHYCRVTRTSTMIDVALRCVSYKPLRSEGDQRPGAVRWPSLLRDIAEVRQLDKDFSKR